MPAAVVYPDAVRREEIVADVDVRRPIPIDVAEHNRKTPIPRNSRERLSRFNQEDPVGPWYRFEMAFTVVQIQNIRLPQFEQPALWCKFELVAIFRPKLEPAPDLQKIKAGASHGGTAIVCDIEVQRAVSIDIPQRHGHRPQFSQ